ncbi:hypothetical protein [Methylorubrum suomiense]|uniref:Uncharacterized protein n=1 Tax=Methylorubrum suomiense TaxID=144191 RepID=A0ABQ4UZL5_9HYPH|nr:hypothetical protein [Methylorubrum suomiense]GJE77760.1 hypothetical protein BGCPKDLD_4367 [Methylorubrum suomiense]
MAEHLRMRRHSADHDDHCLITAYGMNWRITGVSRTGVLSLGQLERPENRIRLDTSAVDFGSYCAEAAAWLAPDLAISNAEALS